MPEPYAEIVRELTSSDLALLETERGIQPSHVQKLSSRHHALAKALATGLSVSDACAITGYTPSRVSILKGDPSFEELVAFYRGPNAELAQDYTTKAAILRNLATDEMIERIEDDPKSIPSDTILDTIKLTADRTGHGPASKTTNTNVFIGLADRLAEARRVESAKLIDVTPEKTDE